jgi:PKD repeat protein
VNVRRFLMAAGLVFPLTWACGGDDLTLPSEGRPANIEIVDGNDQRWRVNSLLPKPLVVRVTDSQNRPVEGVTVQFALDESTAGSVTPSAVTDTAGKAAASITLGTRVGTIKGDAWVAEEDAASELTTEFVAMAAPADAQGISPVTGDGQVAAVGSTLAPLVVQVTDGFDNPIEGVQVDWSVTGGGSISAASTLTDASGLTSVERTLGPTAGPQTTIATAGDLVGSPVTFTHTATAGNAARVVIVSGNGQKGAPGARLPNELVVQVLDAQSNPIAGRAVAWVVGSGGGSASPETSETNEEGQASTRWTLGDAPGRNTLNAVVSGVGVALFEATGAKAVSSTSIVSHQPNPSQIGQAVEVRVEVSGSGATPTGSVNVSSPGADPCSVTLDGGSGSCTLTFRSAGEQQITATYSGDAVFNGSTDTESHRVEAENLAPTAAFTPPSCTAGQPCQFTDGSSDNDGSVVGWAWDFGDGSTSGDRNPIHTYPAPGNFEVKLTVRDNDGATGQVTHTVTVAAPVNAAPVAVNDAYQTPAFQTLQTDASGGVLANDSDPEGASLTATLVDGPSSGILEFRSDGSFTYFPGAAFPGTQDSFTYEVSDGELTSEATVVISITE